MSDQSVPVSGEHHERAVEALRELVALKDGPRDAEYERRKPLAWQAARDVLRDESQGVRLVDLREVTEWLRAQAEQTLRREWDRAADALERRFGSVSE